MDMAWVSEGARPITYTTYTEGNSGCEGKGL